MSKKEIDENKFRDYENNPDYQTLQRCINAIELDYHNAQYIRNKEAHEWKTILLESPMALSAMQEQTEELCKFVIEVYSGLMIKIVRNQTRELCIMAIENAPLSYLYIKYKTHELTILALQKIYGNEMGMNMILVNMPFPLEGEILREYNRLKLFKGDV